MVTKKNKNGKEGSENVTINKVLLGKQAMKSYDTNNDPFEYVDEGENTWNDQATYGLTPDNFEDSEE